MNRSLSVIVLMVMVGASVAPVPVLAHEAGTLRLSGAQIAVGSPLTLTGSLFTKSAVLRLELRGALETLQLGEVRTDAEGAFSLTLTLPPAARAGAYSLVVIADDGDVVARAGLAVLAGGAPAAQETAMPEAHATAEPMELGQGSGPARSAVVLGLLALSLLAGSMLVRGARNAEGEGRGSRAMNRILGAGLVVLAVAGFVSTRRSEPTLRPGAASVPATAPEAAAPASSSMSGMDHASMPGMATSSPTPATTPMPPMEHAGMPGMTAGGSQPARGAAPMDHAAMPGMTAGGSQPARGAAPMDHAAMPGMTAGGSQPARGAAPMDHTAMPGMRPATAPGATPTQPAMAGMDHGAMAVPSDPNQEAASDPEATQKLLELVRRLLEDQTVRQRVETSAPLRSRWQDEAVREELLTPSR